MPDLAAGISLGGIQRITRLKDAGKYLRTVEVAFYRCAYNLVSTLLYLACGKPAAIVVRNDGETLATTLN